jgi:hypothetical protein
MFNKLEVCLLLLIDELNLMYVFILRIVIRRSK